MRLKRSTEHMTPDRKSRPKGPAKRSKEMIEDDKRKKAHKEQPAGAIRITLRCVREPTKHVKMMQFDPPFPMETVRIIAGILDGTSHTFIHKPGPLSPVGKCATCGAALESSIAQMEPPKDAEHPS